MNKEKINKIIEDKVDNFGGLTTDEILKELKEIARILENSGYAEEYPELYRAKQKWVHDYISNLEGARREGEKVRQLLKDGVTVEEISDSVLLSEEVIKEIKKDLNS